MTHQALDAVLEQILRTATEQHSRRSARTPKAAPTPQEKPDRVFRLQAMYREEKAARQTAQAEVTKLKKTLTQQMAVAEKAKMDAVKVKLEAKKFRRSAERYAVTTDKLIDSLNAQIQTLTASLAQIEKAST